MLTPFEAGKNAEHLGIDKTRKFVVVRVMPGDVGHGFGKGEVLDLYREDDTYCPTFKNSAGNVRSMYWSQLAYAPEPTPEVKEDKPFIGHDPSNGTDYSATVYGRHRPDGSRVIDDVVLEPPKEAPGYKLPSDFHVEFAKKDYQPMVGDRVSVEGIIEGVDSDNAWVEVVCLDQSAPQAVALLISKTKLTLLSRPTPKRKITRKEAEKELGDVEIVD